MAALVSRPVVVVGRYAGTVDLLADLLRGGGMPVPATAALDRDGVREVEVLVDGLGGDSVVVVTLSPDDRCCTIVLDRVDAERVVAITWHPADERPPLPAGIPVVEAGRIRADLVRTVVER